MFALFNLSGTLTVWKTNYCQADYERCARFQLVCSGHAVAKNLLPNGKSLNVITEPTLSKP
jgi:hypothetical protein